MSARTSVDVLVDAPTAGAWPVGLAALLRMRTPEGEWVTRTATGLRGARPTGGPGEADFLPRRRPERIEIEPIAWERPEGSGSSAPGPDTRGVPGSPGEEGAGERGSAWAPAIQGPGSVPPAQGTPLTQGSPPVWEPGETLPGQGAEAARPVPGAEVVPPVRKPGTVRPVKGAGGVPPALGVEAVPPVQGSGNVRPVPGAEVVPPVRGAEAVPPVRWPGVVRPVPEAEVVPPEGGSGEVDQGADPGRDRGEVTEVGVQPGPEPYETVTPPTSHKAVRAPKGPGAGRRAEVPGPPVPAGVPGAGQTANMLGAGQAANVPETGSAANAPGAGAAVNVPGAGQVPPLWNDPNLRMPLAAPTAVGAGPPASPAIATDAPPPGAPLPQDVDGPGQEIEPVALWTPSLTGANGFPVVGGSVGGLLGLLWLQARIQRRRGTR
ncbi:hypothetical protein ABZ470_24960 [Streptosporangium sp. NPDC020072]|uniref:hypothetical protein n=1 Tax=Streptosporangium sp. NPDC020072 TaxID=3154788 RepID=UPI003418717F